MQRQDNASLAVIRNRVFDELAIGDADSIERTLTASDIQLFAAISGDVNPQYLGADYAAHTRFHGVIAHGMFGGALISAVLGTRLPGPGTIYRGQTLKFLAPVHIGDTLRTTVTVSARHPEQKRLTLACTCINQDGVPVISGEADVIAPTESIVQPRAILPNIRITPGNGSSSPPLRRTEFIGSARCTGCRVDQTDPDCTQRQTAGSSCRSRARYCRSAD